LNHRVDQGNVRDMSDLIAQMLPGGRIRKCAAGAINTVLGNCGIDVTTRIDLVARRADQTAFVIGDDVGR